MGRVSTIVVAGAALLLTLATPAWSQTLEKKVLSLDAAKRIVAAAEAGAGR